METRVCENIIILRIHVHSDVHSISKTSKYALDFAYCTIKICILCILSSLILSLTAPKSFFSAEGKGFIQICNYCNWLERSFRIWGIGVGTDLSRKNR
mgnify:CR=1 FL=1